LRQESFPRQKESAVAIAPWQQVAAEGRGALSEFIAIFEENENKKASK